MPVGQVRSSPISLLRLLRCRTGRHAKLAERVDRERNPNRSPSFGGVGNDKLHPVARLRLPRSRMTLCAKKWLRTVSYPYDVELDQPIRTSAQGRIVLGLAHNLAYQIRTRMRPAVFFHERTEIKVEENGKKCEGKNFRSVCRNTACRYWQSQ